MYNMKKVSQNYIPFVKIMKKSLTISLAKYKMYIIILTIIVMCLVSCAITPEPESRSTPRISSMEIADARKFDLSYTEPMIRPLVADLSVSSTKVSGTATSRNRLDNRGLENLKNLALRNALHSLQADILVQPIYHITLNDGLYTVTVTGYPATYRDFRHPTDRDDIWIQKINDGIYSKQTPFSADVVIGQTIEFELDQNTPFTVVNSTREPIRTLHIRPSGTQEWGPNILNGQLLRGENTLINETLSQDLYDIQGRDNAGSYTKRNLELQGNRVEFLPSDRGN